MTVPHYMTRNALPGARLVLGDDGLPAFQVHAGKGRQGPVYDSKI